MPTYSTLTCPPSGLPTVLSPEGGNVWRISELGAGGAEWQGAHGALAIADSLFCGRIRLPPLPTHPTELFSVPAWPPIPAAQQKDCPRVAFAGSGLVTRQSPPWHLPLPWPLCLGRCEILIASLGTGLFLSVVSDQNTILSCKYNYVRGVREGGWMGEGRGL